tara:strand:- start:601 stop:843 length:243 start_codon:yes stop_codon:yes gene_type:complete
MDKQVYKIDLREMVRDFLNEGDFSYRSLSDDYQHSIRVVSLKNFLVEMKRRGHTDDELLRALTDIVQMLSSSGSVEDISF